MTAVECHRCRRPIRWAGVAVGYQHATPSACPDAEADLYPAQMPEEILASVRDAIGFAGIQVAAHLSGAPAGMETVLQRLGDAWHAVAVLESWDHPPDLCAWPLWQIMARRWLPVSEGGNREWREERAGLPDGEGSPDAADGGAL